MVRTPHLGGRVCVPTYGADVEKLEPVNKARNVSLQDHRQGQDRGPMDPSFVDFCYSSHLSFGMRHLTECLDGHLLDAPSCRIL